jgi:Na+-transporting methylmalonyl-CoA/oxaloacetate decarboxylase gamma subunit
MYSREPFTQSRLCSVPAIRVTCWVSSLLGWNSHTKPSLPRSPRHSVGIHTHMDGHLEGLYAAYGWSLGRAVCCICKIESFCLHHISVMMNSTVCGELGMTHKCLFVCLFVCLLVCWYLLLLLIFLSIVLLLLFILIYCICMIKSVSFNIRADSRPEDEDKPTRPPWERETAAPNGRSEWRPPGGEGNHRGGYSDDHWTPRGGAPPHRGGYPPRPSFGGQDR